MRKTFRNKRLSKGWTLRDLADQCAAAGIPKPSDSNLSVIERGKTVPRPELRAVLCTLLDLPITYFDQNEQPARRRVASAAQPRRRESVRIRVTPPNDWTCDRPGCGAVNPDSTVTCWKCGG